MGTSWGWEWIINKLFRMIFGAKSLLILGLMMLILAQSKSGSIWKKLPATSASKLLNSFVQLSGPATYYSFKQGSNQRILILLLSEQVDGRSRSLTLEIDLLCTNSEKYEKIQVDTNIVFQLTDEGNNNAYQTEIALNSYAKEHIFTVIFEPRQQLILYSKDMEVGGYSVVFQRDIDDGYFLTFLAVLLLATAVIKEVYRLSMRGNSSYRIRIEATEVMLGWFLKFAFLQSENYHGNLPSLLSTILLLTVLLAFIVEFAYPCLSFSFTPKEKILKYAVILVFMVFNLSIGAIIIAYLVQVLCVFIIKEEGKKLGSVGCYIEIAYILLTTFILEHLLLSPSNVLNYENNTKYAVFLIFATLFQLLYTYTKYTGFILPFERANAFKEAIQNKAAIFFENVNGKSSQEMEESRIGTNPTSARQELANTTENEIKMDESI